MKYVWIAAHEFTYPKRLMYRVLGVSKSGYSAWRTRGESKPARDDALAKLIKQIYEEDRHRSGSPRIHARLQQRGRRHSVKRMARLMAEQGLFARNPRKSRSMTKANPAHQHAPNPLNREFTAVQPYRK
jgi:putative transposase